MEGLVRDAIAHAVRAVDRRSEGLALVADRHSAASRRALRKMFIRPAEPHRVRWPIEW
jgi:hypothetical protein